MRYTWTKAVVSVPASANGTREIATTASPDATARPIGARAARNATTIAGATTTAVGLINAASARKAPDVAARPSPAAATATSSNGPSEPSEKASTPLLSQETGSAQ